MNATVLITLAVTLDGDARDPAVVEEIRAAVAPVLEDFLAATERYNRAAFRRFSLARRLRQQAFDIAFGVGAAL